MWTEAAEIGKNISNLHQGSALLVVCSLGQKYYQSKQSFICSELSVCVVIVLLSVKNGDNMIVAWLQSNMT